MPWASAVPSADPGQAAKHGEVLSCEPDGVQVVTVVGSLVMTSMPDPGSQILGRRLSRLPPGPRDNRLRAGHSFRPDPATARRHSAWVPHQPEAR
jgi:hypothetical protein